MGLPPKSLHPPPSAGHGDGVSTELAAPPSRWQRFRRWVTRVFTAQPEKLDAGADWGTGVATGPAYPAVNSMSSAAGMAWVYACIQARSEDMASLPLKVTIGGRVATDKHPVLELLKRPNSWTTEEQFRRQLYTDRGLSGNGFILQLYSGSRIVSLVRLHPERVTIIPGSFGGAQAYEYRGGGDPQQFPASAVLHVRGPSWEDDPRGMWGLGRIQPLHNDLTAELAATKLAAKAASMGRPDVVLAPAHSGDTWTDAVIAKIRLQWEKLFSKQSGGVVVLGGGVDLKTLSWSPRDMGHEQMELANRAKTLAVFSVPPVRVSLETANFATAKEQSRVYWQSLQAEARLVDATLTELARRLGYKDVEVWHDFSHIDVLQEGQTARLERVKMWVELGATPRQAAAYEGFEDAPVSDVAPQPKPTATPTPSKASSSVPPWGWPSSDDTPSAK